MKTIEEIFSLKKLPSFYAVNIAGWLFMIAVDSVVFTIWMQGEFTFLSYFSNALQWSIGIVLTSLLRVFYKKIYLKGMSILKILSVIVVLSFISAFLLFFLSHIIYFLFSPYDLSRRISIALSSGNIVFRMTQLFPIMTAWSMLYFGIKFWFDIAVEKEKVQRAEYLAQTARLQMLRYQINPHFLFNSFSSLRALIRSNPEIAVDMVGELSEFYRYTLVVKNSSMVQLNTELEAVKHYAAIEKLRFDDKIEFDFNIEPEAGEFLIPSFLIHPLVENAIKYGMKTSTLPLKIGLLASVENKHVKIEVTNSGKWIEPTNNQSIEGTKTGLDNVRDRLELTYPDNSKLDVYGNDGFVKAVIIIGLEK